MNVFMFVGQGAELPWVTADVLADPAVAALLAQASEHTGADIARLLVRGGRELARTEILQPAMIAVCLGVARMLERAAVHPAITLGHSLGELAAWSAAGGITAEDAVAIAAVRGRLMAREAARRPGGMLRLIADRATCERAVEAGTKVGWMTVCAHNGPDEWGLCGDEAALAAVLAGFRAVRVPVSGAWHSPAMAGALDELGVALRALPRRPMQARLVTNRSGAFTDDDAVPEVLAGGLVHPIEFVDALRTVDAVGAVRLIAVGPGKLLRAMVRRNLGMARDLEIVDSAGAVEAAAGR